MIKELFLLLLCIKIIKCEGTNEETVCNENETYAQCENAFCGPKTCAELGYPKPCPGGTTACRGGCVCVDTYVRDDKNICIPMQDCPSCGGDKNATSGCGNYCGNSCSDYKETDKVCLSGCRYNSCACKKGYVYSEKDKKCLLPVDCPNE